MWRNSKTTTIYTEQQMKLLHWKPVSHRITSTHLIDRLNNHQLKWPKSTFLILGLSSQQRTHVMLHVRLCRMWPKRLGMQKKFCQQLLGTAFKSGSYDAFKSQTTHRGLEESWRSGVSGQCVLMSAEERSEGLHSQLHNMAYGQIMEADTLGWEHF